MALALMVTGCSVISMSAQAAHAADEPGAKTPAGLLDPMEVKTPGLKVGDKAPSLTLKGADGATMDLASLYAKGPVVVTFYRGGWCPFCQRAMANWNPKIGELGKAGGTFVAISPETPEHALESKQKFGGDNVVALVDTNGQAMRAFHVGFALDSRTKSRYQQFGHDLGAWNASGRWELPAPATFIVDKTGVIRWVFAAWNFTKRADPDEVIAAVNNLTHPGAE